MSTRTKTRITFRKPFFHLLHRMMIVMFQGQFLFLLALTTAVRGGSVVGGDLGGGGDGGGGVTSQNDGECIDLKFTYPPPAGSSSINLFPDFCANAPFFIPVCTDPGAINVFEINDECVTKSDFTCDDWYVGGRICQVYRDSTFTIDKTIHYDPSFTCSQSEDTVTITMQKFAGDISQGYTGPSSSCSDVNSAEYLAFRNSQGPLTYDNDKVSYYICTGTAACPPTTRRNLMMIGNEIEEGKQEEYKELYDACGGYDYEGFLHVTSHLVLLGVPGEKARSVGCPIVTAHAVIGADTDPTVVARKEATFWFDQAKFDNVFSLDDTMSFGHFQLQSLVQAYQNAEVTNSDRNFYDVIQNNCATFVKNVASQLGVPVDARVKSFVTRRLLNEGGSSLIESIRNSIHFPSLFNNENGRNLRQDSSRLANENLIALLVDRVVLGI